MALIIPNSFAARSGSIQLSEIDDNFQYLAGEIDVVNNIVTGNITGTGTTVLSDSPALTGTTTAVNLTLSGDLTVNGTTTTVNTTNTVVKDSLIELNNGAASNANDIGIIFQRGTTGANAAFVWDETNDRFSLGTTTATGASTGTLSVTKGSLSADLVGNADTVTNGLYTTNFTGAGNQSVTANGYQKLPGGLIMQWGVHTTTQTGNSNATLDTNFPTAFPTACFSFVAVPYNSGVSVDGDTGVNFSSTQFGIIRRNSSGLTHSWIAIGH
jgi:hypothetical protein